MRALARLAVVTALAASASGCITAVTTIKLRPDGSGTIDQVLSMNAAAAAQFAEMAKGLGGDSKGASAEPEFFTEKEMREAATKFGEGVTFVSSKPIKTADRVGRIATYQFADISKLRIEQKPQTGDMPGASADGKKEDVLFRFARKPAGTSQLTVVFPEEKFDEARKNAGAGGDKGSAGQKVEPAQLEMMKKLFDGLKIAIDVEVLGTIVKTNSPFVQGSKVTLLEMDFAELIKNDKLLAEVGEPKSIEEAKAILKDVKGFKVNLDREVTIEFK